MSFTVTAVTPLLISPPPKKKKKQQQQKTENNSAKNFLDLMSGFDNTDLKKVLVYKTLEAFTFRTIVRKQRENAP